MLLKKKLCICAIFCGVLLFWLASYTIQKNYFLPMMNKATHSTDMTLRITQTQSRTVTDTSHHHSCGCPTCVTDPGVSEWFDKRFDNTQEPYLSPNENQIDPDSLKWWLVSKILIILKILEQSTVYQKLHYCRKLVKVFKNSNSSLLDAELSGLLGVSSGQVFCRCRRSCM